jgi:hypothetical protein
MASQRNTTVAAKISIAQLNAHLNLRTILLTTQAQRAQSTFQLLFTFVFFVSLWFMLSAYRRIEAA